MACAAASSTRRRRGPTSRRRWCCGRARSSCSTMPAPSSRSSPPACGSCAARLFAERRAARRAAVRRRRQPVPVRADDSAERDRAPARGPPERSSASRSSAASSCVGFRAARDAVDGASARRVGASEESVRAAWLVGCDGAHSTVRHGLGMDFAGSAEPNDWMLADVHIARPRRPRRGAHLLARRGHARLLPDRHRPLPHRRRRRPGAVAERPPDPTLADVQAVLDARGPGGLTVHDPIWLASFRINERKVADYRAGRVFLAGDAAHIHSPAGGQGMNTGMQDAFNLAWKLALVARRARARAAARQLQPRAQRGRRPGAAQRRRDDPRRARCAIRAAQRLRNALLPLLASLGVVRTAMRDTLTEMNINYRAGPLQPRRSVAGGARPRALTAASSPAIALRTPRSSMRAAARRRGCSSCCAAAATACCSAPARTAASARCSAIAAAVGGAYRSDRRVHVDVVIERAPLLRDRAARCLRRARPRPPSSSAQTATSGTTASRSTPHACAPTSPATSSRSRSSAPPRRGYGYGMIPCDFRCGPTFVGLSSPGHPARPVLAVGS